MRPLIGTDPALAGILHNEMNFLAERKAAGQGHPKEDSLQGELAGIRYLRLYRQGESVRLYFVVDGGVIWMLHLEVSKRRTNVSDATVALLKARRRDLPSLAATRNRREANKSAGRRA